MSSNESGQEQRARAGCLGDLRSERGERDDSKAAGQQAQPSDAKGGDSDRVGAALEALFKEYKRQNAEARSQRPQEEANNENVARLAVASTIIAGAVLATSVWQSFSVQGQLNAALTTNRAWISIDPKISSAIEFGPGGSARFDLTATLKNVGHSPATGINIAATGTVLISGQSYSVRERLVSACEKATEDTIAPVMLFPDETHVSEVAVTISGEDMRRGTIRSAGPRGDAVIPLLYVCVNYDDAGSGSKGKRTAFGYTVGLRADKPRALKTVPINGETDPPDALILRRDFFGGGGLAD